MTITEFTETCTSHRCAVTHGCLRFSTGDPASPQGDFCGTIPTQLLAMCSGSLGTTTTTYLPGSQGDQTCVFAKRTFLHLAHKLGQLGVSAAAVVDLQ